MTRKLIYYIYWGFQTIIRKKKIPLNSSLILTDRCNLACRHCTVANLGYTPMSFEDVRRDLRTLYNTGSRMLVITGGEPMIWRDQNGITVENVVSIAKEIGFFRIVICTNGTLPLESSADYLWVSLDGFENEHNEMRGSVYKNVIKNILSSSHKRLYINYTISNNNCRTFPESAENILSLKNVRGILFHLYTPYLGGDSSLILNDTNKVIVLKQLSAFKRRHPIATFNTFAGLKALSHNHWERPIWASVTINQSIISECCCRIGIYDENVCKQCGCSPAAETWVLQTLKFSALLENLRYI